MLKRPPCACGKNCFKSLTYKSLKFLRYKYWTRSRQLRSQWLIQTVKNSESKGKFSYFTTENGHKLCSIAFLKAYGINKNLLVKCRSLAQRNRVATDVKKTRELSVSSVECIGWLENYFSACGDRMPDKDLIYLPYRTTKLYVYNIYKQDTLSPVSKATFGVIWKQHFPHVKFKKVSYIHHFYYYTIQFDLGTDSLNETHAQCIQPLSLEFAILACTVKSGNFFFYFIIETASQVPACQVF